MMYDEPMAGLYQQTDIAIQAAAATPHQLVMMLFDGLRDELICAKGHIEAGRYEHKVKSINKCINILNGLTSVLNYEDGGDLSVTISKLYDYCVYRLYEASNLLSIEIIAEVEGILAALYQGWEGMKH
ncbi:flagellar export chaperone FliS [Yersinia pseudotuberculosis]|nr:flagellar export chaperone FliS [Yersinia pseudotuberculosis]AJJ72949.1 flagellar protein FliS [Yersinia pseudotuberculosis]PSH13499.1 flagellar protein FliS [Yersinia pseudotuberculosis]PSH38899.1 flagellar export chaperone FliS [Yersinia pseudotuberculosis]PSH40012.1 flagellar export chaperone FliS [Yersinia pseudotuberculosis]CNL01827.1 flagellar protein FliS [Yersinia pseudotuberculosis]